MKASETSGESIRTKAKALGFDAVGFLTAETDANFKQGLRHFLEKGYHGDMAWLEANAARRADPQTLWPEAKSVIVLGMNYAPAKDALALLATPGLGNISVYARGADYHDTIKKRLKQLAGWIADTFTCEVKVFVDTAPLMEKPLAEKGGIGWQGKHTNLVSRHYGSWLFLGEILTTLPLPPDAPEKDHCGDCHACLDVCPTQAFPKAYELDARRCISYLTIEHKGVIPREFREPMGNRIYGCDDCLAVCPWNKFARQTKEYAFLPRSELEGPALAELLELDDAAFRQRFAGSAIKRIGYPRFLRNVLIALGNSGNSRAVPAVKRRLSDPSPLVRGMAVWALHRLMNADTFAALKARHASSETDAAVQEEWAA
ncbi:MAG: tRNA epoxyqueuosine(34) reductase QueG [Alphaproteobacteria bacterium]|nr:tRNA epoxyqueuosine(34) reductase QueG [Alphaproteobacteria bacterium]